MSRRRQPRPGDLEAQAQRFVDERDEVLPAAEPVESLPMYRPTSGDPTVLGSLGRDPSEVEVPMSRQGRQRPMWMPSDPILGRRAGQPVRRQDYDDAVRRYDADLARRQAEAAARPEPGPEPWQAPEWWSEIGPSRQRYLAGSGQPDRPRGDISQKSEGSILRRDRLDADVAARALELATRYCRARDAEWLTEHQWEIYRAADEGRPHWMTVSPWHAVTAEAVDAFRDEAEWAIAVERRPEDPAAWLMERRLPAVRAIEAAAGRSPKAAVAAEKRRIRALASAPGGAMVVAGQGRPECSADGCRNLAEPSGRGGWRSLCGACRKARQRTGQARSKRNVNAANRRKGRS